MDRNLYKSNKKLADQGWRSMRKALDRELPEQRRRRPVALFWILGLLLPGAGALAWFLGHPGHTNAGLEYQGAIVRHEPVVPVPLATESRSIKMPVPPADIQVSRTGHAGSAQNTENQLVQNGDIFTDNQSTSMPRKPDVSPDAKQPLPQLGSPLRRHVQRIQPEQVQITAFVPHTEALVQVHFGENAPSEQSTVKHLKRSVPGIAFNPASNPPLPTSLTPAAANAPVQPVAAPESPIKPSPEQSVKKWSFGVSAGVLSDLASGSTGATTGLTTEWRPGRKWGLRSGLAYQYQALETSDRALVSLTTATFAEATGDSKGANGFGTPTSPATSSTAPVYVPIARLHRLEMPVQAFWQPFRKLRIWGGGTVGTNVFAETADRSLIDNTVYLIPSGQASKNLNAEISNQVRSWDAHWVAGIGFRPGRRWSIDLFYSHPLGSRQQAQPSSKFDVSNTPNNPGDVVADPNAIGKSARFQLSATLFF